MNDPMRTGTTNPMTQEAQAATDIEEPLARLQIKLAADVVKLG